MEGFMEPIKSLENKTSATRRYLRGDIAKRMNFYTQKSEDCWLWNGPVTNKGYGRISVGDRPKSAHRVAYELANGAIPEGLVIDHKCHTPLCVRPDHLQAVSIKQNSENRAGAAPRSASGVRGVSLHRASGLWVVEVTHNYRKHYGGYFRSLEDAEVAAVELRNRLFTNNLLDSEEAA
jgi:hypothetical protein